MPLCRAQYDTRSVFIGPDAADVISHARMQLRSVQETRGTVYLRWIWNSKWTSSTVPGGVVDAARQDIENFDYLNAGTTRTSIPIWEVGRCICLREL